MCIRDRHASCASPPRGPRGCAGGVLRQGSGSRRSHRPDAIVTSGGYVAIPILAAARLLRIPAVLWEGNVVPGRSVRATARLADVVAVSFEATCAALGVERCYVTGTPIRDPRAIDREAARERLG